MKSELGIARSAVFGLGFRLERDEATTEGPDQEGSEQRWIEGEGHGFAKGDLLEVWMRGIEQVVRLRVNDHAWQLQHDGACFLHPPITDLHAGRRRRFLGPVSRQVRRGDGLQQRLVKLDRDGHLLECHWRIEMNQTFERRERKGGAGVNPTRSSRVPPSAKEPGSLAIKSSGSVLFLHRAPGPSHQE